MPQRPRRFGLVVGSAAIITIAFFGILYFFYYISVPNDVGPGTIEVASATYGGNCRGVSLGNVTRFVEAECNGRQACNYRLDVTVVGDPAAGCAKEFVAEYRCGPEKQPRTSRVSAEAAGSIAQLSCAAASP
jgi:hypothetical protein